MNKEKLIQKWLDNELNEAEFNQLQQLEEFQDYKKIAETAKQFKAPNFDKKESFAAIKSKLVQPKTKTSWTKHIARIAAIFVIGFATYFAITYNSATEIQTMAGVTEEITLPDESHIELNAASTLSYNKSNWEDKRLINLKGEAYFEVAKGKTFTVETSLGNISVLGTKFNIRQRGDFLEVTCYEGLVKVVTPFEELKLPVGESFQLIGKTSLKQSISSAKPSWLEGVSSFRSVPLQQVIEELEHQYNITITLKKLTFDTDELFTGSFVHNDLKTALKSITVPFNLTYEQNNTTVILSERE
ncbi:FecR family protein [Mesonia maritima]|uniref:Ferric-dicitrate binding protein FerR (Iron transport regulator) n=1 Tax=Mesonia maritima TaxID=1793873 RepID=A0ABU1K6S5_9FLAO|nr:FecR family protein [Mesonia maritima]MDR6301308.1 ferric-dicitrate binding protein FerR (iron transport regulator) [Mesonia maritima]